MQKSLVFSALSQVHEFLLHGLWVQLLKGISIPAISLSRWMVLSFILEVAT